MDKGGRTMEPKKQAGPHQGQSSDSAVLKETAGVRRPVGLQTMGPALYEQLRRALHQMEGARKR